MTKSLKLGILFSKELKAAIVARLVIPGISPLTSFILALREALVAKLIILGISFLTSFTLVLRVVLEAKLVISGISSSLPLILALYTSFLATSFLLHHLVYLNQQEQILTYQHQMSLLYVPDFLNFMVYFLIYQYLIYPHQILN